MLMIVQTQTATMNRRLIAPDRKASTQNDAAKSRRSLKIPEYME